MTILNKNIFVSFAEPTVTWWGGDENDLSIALLFLKNIRNLIFKCGALKKANTLSSCMQRKLKHTLVTIKIFTFVFHFFLPGPVITTWKAFGGREAQHFVQVEQKNDQEYKEASHHAQKSSCFSWY